MIRWCTSISMSTSTSTSTRTLESWLMSRAPQTALCELKLRFKRHPSYLLSPSHLPHKAAPSSYARRFCTPHALEMTDPLTNPSRAPTHAAPNFRGPGARARSFGSLPGACQVVTASESKHGANKSFLRESGWGCVEQTRR